MRLKSYIIGYSYVPNLPIVTSYVPTYLPNVPITLEVEIIAYFTERTFPILKSKFESWLIMFKPVDLAFLKIPEFPILHFERPRSWKEDVSSLPPASSNLRPKLNETPPDNYLFDQCIPGIESKSRSNRQWQQLLLYFGVVFRIS